MSMLIVPLFMLVLMLMMMRLFAKKMNVTFSNSLPIEIVQAKKQQKSAGNSWEPVPDSFIQCDPEYRQEQTQQRGEENVAAACESRNQQGLRAIPSLDTRGQHKRQPVCRHCRVKKCDTKTSNRDCSENSLVYRHALTFPSLAKQFQPEKQSQQLSTVSEGFANRRAPKIRTGLLSPWRCQVGISTAEMLGSQFI